MTTEELKQKGVLVDEIDEYTLSAHPWYLSPRQEVMFHLSEKGTVTTMYLSRVIMSAPTRMAVDHINGNKLDNRRSNLRICSQQQNCCNQRKRVDNKSGYKGVYWHKQQQKWVVQIISNKQRRNLGVFTDVREAALAYNKAAIELHGSFAKLNEVV